MKKMFLVAAAVAAISFSFTTDNNVLPIGADLPKADLKLKDISGKEVSLKEAKKEKWTAGNVQLQYLSLGYQEPVKN